MGQRFSLGKLICCAALCCLCMSGARVYSAEDSGIFADATAKVHTAMSEESNIVANLIVGSMFEVVDAQLDGDGNIWYQVKTDFGVDGYVKSDELERVIVKAAQDNGSIDNNADNNDVRSNGADNSDVDNNDAGSNNADSDIDNDDIGNYTDNYDIDGNNVDNPASTEPLGELNVLETINFRRQPSTDSEIIAKIEGGTKLTYYEKHINEQGELWYQVLYGDISGYVADSAVEIVQQEQTDDAKQTDNAAVPPTANETPPSQATAQSSGTEAGLSAMTVSETVSDLAAGAAPKRKLHHIGHDLLAAACILGDALCVVILALLINKAYKLTRIVGIGKKVKKQEKRSNAYRR